MTFEGARDPAFCSGALRTKMAGPTSCLTTGILVSLALLLMFTPCHYLSGRTSVSVGLRVIDERFTAEYLLAAGPLFLDFHHVRHMAANTTFMALSEIVSRSVLRVGHHGLEFLTGIVLMLVDQVHQRRVFFDVSRSGPGGRNHATLIIHYAVSL